MVKAGIGSNSIRHGKHSLSRSYATGGKLHPPVTELLVFETRRHAEALERRLAGRLFGLHLEQQHVAAFTGRCSAWLPEH